MYTPLETITIIKVMNISDTQSHLVSLGNPSFPYTLIPRVTTDPVSATLGKFALKFLKIQMELHSFVPGSFHSA